MLLHSLLYVTSIFPPTFNLFLKLKPICFIKLKPSYKQIVSCVVVRFVTNEVLDFFNKDNVNKYSMYQESF